MTKRKGCGSITAAFFYFRANRIRVRGKTAAAFIGSSLCHLNLGTVIFVP